MRLIVFLFWLSVIVLSVWLAIKPESTKTLQKNRANLLTFNNLKLFLSTENHDANIEIDELQYDELQSKFLVNILNLNSKNSLLQVITLLDGFSWMNMGALSRINNTERVSQSENGSEPEKINILSASIHTSDMDMKAEDLVLKRGEIGPFYTALFKNFVAHNVSIKRHHPRSSRIIVDIVEWKYPIKKPKFHNGALIQNSLDRQEFTIATLDVASLEISSYNNKTPNTLKQKNSTIKINPAVTKKLQDVLNFELDP